MPVLATFLLAAATSLAGWEPAGPGEFSLEDVGFMVGRWDGVKGDDPVEEHWMAPRAGVMVGTMRWIRDGKLHLTELMEVSEEHGEVMLRAKHFRPRLRGIEPADESAEFVLESAGPGRAVWKMRGDGPAHRMVYARKDDALTVRFEAEQGPPLVNGEFVFRLVRG